MTARPTAYGGPFDGMAVVLGERMGRFAWIGLSKKGEAKTYAKPAPSRELYRAEQLESTKGKYVAWTYAENLWFRCDGCGTFHKRVEGGAEKPDCHLCGDG